MNTRNFLLAATGVIAMTSVSTAAFAAGTVSATAPASVTVLSPFTIAKTQDLAFGTVVRPQTGSITVAIDANDIVTSNGPAGTVVSSTTSSAHFLLTGLTTAYTTTQTLAFTQPGLTSISVPTPVATTGTFGALTPAGTQELRVGGQFTMSAATTAQLYTGTLTLTVNYN